MQSPVAIHDKELCNILQVVLTVAESPSSSSATTATTTDSTISSSAKASVRKAAKTNAKAPPAGGKDKTVRRSWKKPKDKPKRPLSAYNLFFQAEREKLVGGVQDAPDATKHTSGTTKRRRRREAHGKISFTELAKHISAKWKTLDACSRTALEARADVERARYKREVEEWKRNKEQKDLLQQQASILQEGECLTDNSQQMLKNEVLQAPAYAIDMNAILSDLTLQSLMAKPCVLDASSFSFPVANHLSSIRALNGEFPTSPMNIGQRSTGQEAAYQRHSVDAHDIPPIGIHDESVDDSAELGLQNDLSQLDALDAMLDKLDSEYGADDFFHLGENDTFGLQVADESLSLPTKTSDRDDPFSLNSFVDECMETFDQVDQDLAALLD